MRSMAIDNSVTEKAFELKMSRMAFGSMMTAPIVRGVERGSAPLGSTGGGWGLRRRRVDDQRRKERCVRGVLLGLGGDAGAPHQGGGIDHGERLQHHDV